MTKGQPPGRSTLIAFSAPTLPLAALGLPLVVYLPEYYANHLGLNLAMVGFAFMAVRFSDIFLDPLFGEFMDRTRTRLGRFRPWMLLNTPVLALSTYMLFMAEKGVGPLYLWFWLAVTYITYSAVILAHTSWASVLSSDYDQRSRIYGYWQAGNVIGMILVLALPPILTAVAHMDYAGGLQAMGWFIVLLLPLTILWASRAVSEPVNLAPVAHRPASMKAYFDLFKNDSVRRIMIADLTLGLAPGITGALFFFFFEQVKDLNKTQAGLMLLVYFIAALVGAPLWSRLSLAIGKHRALVVASIVYAITQTALVFWPATSLPVMAVGLFLAGLPYAAAAVLLRSMLADVGDEELLSTGIDRTGLLYAVLAGTNKIGYALAVGVTYFGLDALGFKAGSADNGAETLFGLQLLYGLVPGGLAVIAAWAIHGYSLDATRHSSIREALRQRDEAQTQLES
jgi:glycoside/pentoside/hexuronide:cation symporter, GPH family